MSEYDFKMMADIRDWVNWLFLNHEYFKNAEVFIQEMTVLWEWIKYYSVSIVKDWVYHYTKDFYI